MQMLFLRLLRIAVLARVISHLDNFAASAIEFLLVLFFHLLDTSAIRVVEFVRVGIEYVSLAYLSA